MVEVERARMCLLMMSSALQSIGELFDQLDRGFGEGQWEKMGSMEAVVLLGWRQLPETYRPQLPTLADAVAKKQALHNVWGSVLDEVGAALEGLERRTDDD